MSSRDAILSRVRTALAGEGPRETPPVHPVWPRENPSVDKMAERFSQELQLVSGEAIRCRSTEEAQLRLGDLVEQGQWKAVGAMDRPLVRELVGGLAPGLLDWGKPAVQAQEMAHLDAAVVEADSLVADTGTSMVACGTTWERLLCYLPPVCVVVATADRLVEHLPAAWDKVAPRAADLALRGEFVFITGPSRTADIEKILILGVHGPKRLVVLLVAT
jgi:L-lactate dehydrogenase complex protein LldG